MKVFNCILGVFAIFSSIYCIFWPGITFLNTGWIITILLGVWGFCAIFSYFSVPKEERKTKSKAAMGTAGLVAGIAAAVVSVLAIFMPQIMVMFDVIILWLFVGWLILSGIMSIVGAVGVKKTTESKSWILTLILGILVLLAGIYGIFNLFVMAQAAGLLIGVYLMVYGVRLFCSVFEKY